MPRHRRRAKRRTRRKRVKNMTKKQLVKLIHATALKDAETKVYDVGVNLLAVGPWGPIGPYVSISWLIPTYQNVPKIKNTSTPTNISVIGNEFHMRGVKYKFFIRMSSTTAAFGQIHVRLTLLSTSRPDMVVNPNAPNLTVPGAWYETDTILPTTMQRWDNQEVTVLKSKRFVMNPGTNVSQLKLVNFWCPLRGKKVTAEDESLIVNTMVSNVKGKNYFVAVEVFNAQGTDMSTGLSLYYDQVAYFKDP